MDRIELFQQGQFIDRFPSRSAAARWIMAHDRVEAGLEGGEWASRIFRAWIAKGNRSVTEHQSEAEVFPTAFHAEAAHIRAVGWSG